jgi:hypothetical protein
MRGNALRTGRLGWGLALWQWRRCLGLVIVAMCLTAVFVAADASYSVAIEQTELSVASTYRGYALQIVPKEEGVRVEGAVPVQTDEVQIMAGSHAASATRLRVGLDSYSSDPRVAEYGRLLSGRHPSSAGEVTLSERAAARLAVSVGAEVEVGPERFSVVGVFVLPADPGWMAVSGIASPRIDTATAWLTNGSTPEYLEGRSKSTWVEFDTMLAVDTLKGGSLGFVRFFRPALVILAACLLAFGVMLFASGVSTERRGLIAAGMPENQASRVVSVACGICAFLGLCLGWAIVALAFTLQPAFVGHFWGMRWADVSPPGGYTTAVFALVVMCVALLLPALSSRGPNGQRWRRRKPLPRLAGWLAVALCCASAAALIIPGSRTLAATVGTSRWWLVLSAAAVVPLALPFVFSATTRRSQERALVYVSRQRASRLVPGLVVLALVVFLANAVGTMIAHDVKTSRAFYLAPQPAGSMAVREVPNPQVVRDLAKANPGDEISTRFDRTGLLVLSPSTAELIQTLPPPITEETLLLGLDPALDGDKAIWIGNVGEADETWTSDLRPSVTRVLAAPPFVEDGQVVLGRVQDGTFVRLATIAAEPTWLMGGGGGGFPNAVVDSVARYGGQAYDLWNIALLGYDELSSADQGQLEGLARSLAPTAFVEVDEGYQDGGLYAFSQLLGYAAAIIVALVAVGLGLQVISEEAELRGLIKRSGRRWVRRRLMGVVAFLPLGASAIVAATAGLVFSFRTASSWGAGFGSTTIGLVVFAAAVTVVLGLLHAAEAD